MHIKNDAMEIEHSFRIAVLQVPWFLVSLVINQIGEGINRTFICITYHKTFCP